MRARISRGFDGLACASDFDCPNGVHEVMPTRALAKQAPKRGKGFPNAEKVKVNQRLAIVRSGLRCIAYCRTRLACAA